LDTFLRAVCGIFSRVIFYTADVSEPAIYSLPPVISGDSQFCSGLQFDALANNIPEGWACVAVKAVDNVGNVGISRPLRIFIDYTRDDQPFYNVADAPDCTGTYDKQTNVTTNAACAFDPETQEFPENEVRREDP